MSEVREGRQTRYGPALLLVKLLAHGLRHPLELTLGLGIVSLNHKGV